MRFDELVPKSLKQRLKFDHTPAKFKKKRRDLMSQRRGLLKQRLKFDHTPAKFKKKR